MSFSHSWEVEVGFPMGWDPGLTESLKSPLSRIWGIGGSYLNIPQAIFYLLKGDYTLSLVGDIMLQVGTLKPCASSQVTQTSGVPKWSRVLAQIFGSFPKQGDPNIDPKIL